MAKGKRENFRVILLLDRQGRKTLDRMLEICRLSMHHAVRHAMHRLETLKLVTPLDDFERAVQEFTKDANLFEETQKEIARHACDLYTQLVADQAKHDPRRAHALILAIPLREVIFSSSGRQVKVPYLGVVNYRRNMFAVSSEGGVHVPQVAHKMLLGYHNNEPCLMLMTVEPAKPKSPEIGEQKLVKLTASEIARRRKASGKRGSESQEPK
jgi:hypothetical protein